MTYTPPKFCEKCDNPTSLCLCSRIVPEFPMTKLEKHIAMANKAIMNLPPHDQHAHEGLPLSQSGFKVGCGRCQWLRKEDAQRKRIIAGMSL